MLNAIARLQMDRRAPASDRNVKNCNALEASLHSRQLSAAARDKAASTSLRLVAVLEVLFKYARRPWRLRNPSLTRLATKPGEKAG
jgi:hypothetical protein